MEQFKIWDLNNQIINQVYEQDNYQCVDTGIESDICYIFFSSHGLYYPDTEAEFEETIINRDRYEWKWMANNSRIPTNAGRIIYVRDIHKRYYIYGISKKYNTIDKVLDRLRELTAGYRIVTVGSSAGGYMALIAAVRLNAEYCINIAGIICLDKKAVESTDIRECYKNIAKLVETYRGGYSIFMPHMMK